MSASRELRDDSDSDEETEQDYQEADQPERKYQDIHQAEKDDAKSKLSGRMSSQDNWSVGSPTMSFLLQ